MHWFVSTTRRTCVAFVAGMSNERISSSGDTGRGVPPGNALRRARVHRREPGRQRAAGVQGAGVAGLDRELAQGREAVLARSSIALTWTRLIVRACVPARSTVTCGPRTSVEPVRSHCVSSVSSIRFGEVDAVSGRRRAASFDAQFEAKLERHRLRLAGGEREPEALVAVAGRRSRRTRTCPARRPRCRRGSRRPGGAAVPGVVGIGVGDGRHAAPRTSRRRSARSPGCCRRPARPP